MYVHMNVTVHLLYLRCGKCHRFMKYIAAKPHRLYCMHCDETYSLPPGGTVKLYKVKRVFLNTVFMLNTWLGIEVPIG